MFIDLTTNIRKNVPFLFREKLKIRNFIFIASCWAALTIFFGAKMISDIEGAYYPKTSKNTHSTFYGYGKYIEYDDYDLEKPKYQIITSVKLRNKDKKINNTVFGYYHVLPKNKSTFDKQKENTIVKYTTNAAITTQDINTDWVSLYTCLYQSLLLVFIIAAIMVCSSIATEFDTIKKN